MTFLPICLVKFQFEIVFRKRLGAGAARNGSVAEIIDRTNQAGRLSAREPGSAIPQLLQWLH
jgi:hypothetical protein